MSNKRMILPIAALVAAATTSASAQTVLSWTFSDLSGTYASTSPTAGNFAAVWNPASAGGSVGDVTRLLAPGGTAPFAGGTSSSVNFSLAVSNVNNIVGTADGLGSFSITGGNGSVLSGSLNGTFFRIGSGPTAGLQFNGSVTGVNITGATFAGNPTTGGSFSNDFSSVGGFGALTGFGIILTIPNNAGQFLTTSFGPVSTQSSGQLIPSPGTLALLGLGGLVAARRRRA